MKGLGWQTKSAKQIYKSKWLTVTNYEVLSPKEKLLNYDIVDRKNFSLIIPKIDDSFYLVKQFRYTINDYSLEFPQGFYEDEESPEENAKRELKEETGLKSKKLTLLNTLYVSVGFLRQKFTVFLAEDFIHEKQSLDESEEGLTLEKITKEDIIKKLNTGEICSAPTVAALGLYLLSEQRLPTIKS